MLLVNLLPQEALFLYLHIIAIVLGLKLRLVHSLINDLLCLSCSEFSAENKVDIVLALLMLLCLPVFMMTIIFAFIVVNVSTVSIAIAIVRWLILLVVRFSGYDLMHGSLTLDVLPSLESQIAE